LGDFTLQLGVKTDPVEYRFSYEWLFRLLVEEGIRHVQLGTFFEIYQLPDEYFHRLRRRADDLGIAIHSIFTAHRELGWFFIDEPGWEAAARRNYERLVEVGALVGARSVGSNPGAVYRDRMGSKRRGVECFLRHMRELMGFAHERGVEWLVIEPMSCLAEPPTLPDEIRSMADELDAYHRQHAESTARIGYCADVAHAYLDRDCRVVHDHLELLEAALPYLVEVHLKNTDSQYCSTFGFSPAEREVGVIGIEPVRQLMLSHAERIPVDCLTGYLEIGGPKLGRDYSDSDLADQLRQSLCYLKEVWPGDGAEPAEAPGQPRADAHRERDRSSQRPPAQSVRGRDAAPTAGPVRVAPSVMCADLCHLEEGVRQLEAAGADMLHVDVADGHFVPNLLLGLDVIRQLRVKTALAMDVHLMVDNPDAYVEPLAEIGVEMVAVHAEACRHLDRTLTEIRARGMKAGVALNPATPLAALDYVWERLDFLLLMTVNPGFAGQTLVAGAIRKIADGRRLVDERGTSVPIMVDGNVSFEHIPKMVAAVADVLVAGTSSWFHPGGSLQENVEKTQQAIASGLEMRKR
jgi:ribulose-phosphate 3-epimerase